jgi:predicted esterase
VCLRNIYSSLIEYIDGLGDTGNGGWLQTWQAIQQKAFPSMRIVLPTAQNLPVSLNSGFKMPAWYDIIGLSENSAEDINGIELCKNFVHHLILQEMINTGISSERIVLAGFSQGGSIALYGGFTCPLKLAGIIGLSTWALRREELLKVVQSDSTVNRSTPFFMGHGSQDAVVKFHFGQMSYNTLSPHLTGSKEFKVYNSMGHSSSNQEMNDLLQFITQKCL